VIPATDMERAGNADLDWVAVKAGLKMKRVTAHERVGPSPIAGGDDGFSINARKRVWRDRRCGVGGGDAISLYAHIYGLNLNNAEQLREAVEALTGENIKQAPPPPSRQEDKAERDRKIREALGIWQASGDPNETPVVKAYLNSRDLALPDDIAGSVIRWHERGAMVCLMRNVLTGEPQAVHQTLLDAQGRKRFVTLKGAEKQTCRLFNGPVGGAAVMFDPPGSELFVAEGVESALTGRQDGYAPAWAVGSCSEIRKLPVLPWARSLTFFRERCPKNAEAAEACGKRWRAAGRKPFDIWPPVGCKDLNDAIRVDLQ
jgi:putative DNA primase/helicase